MQELVSMSSHVDYTRTVETLYKNIPEMTTLACI